MTRALLAAGLLAANMFFILPATAQDARPLRSPVLLIDTDKLYLESAFGRRVAREIARQGEELANENRRIEAELEDEEKALTDQRASLEPNVFRDLADAFDKKVRDTRQQQETKARALVARQESYRNSFLSSAAPILEELMREAGAVVVLDQRSVLLSLRAINVTDDARTRIDEEIGDGSAIDEEPAQE